jgi:hypothetical protein
LTVRAKRQALPLFEPRCLGLFLTVVCYQLTVNVEQALKLDGCLRVVDGREQFQDNELCIEQSLFDER